NPHTTIVKSGNLECCPFANGWCGHNFKYRLETMRAKREQSKEYMKSILSISAFLGLLLLGGTGCVVHEPYDQAYYQNGHGYYGNSYGYWDRGHYHHYHGDRNDWRAREYDSYPQ